MDERRNPPFWGKPRPPKNTSSMNDRAADESVYPSHIGLWGLNTSAQIASDLTIAMVRIPAKAGFQFRRPCCVGLFHAGYLQRRLGASYHAITCILCPLGQHDKSGANVAVRFLQIIFTARSLQNVVLQASRHKPISPIRFCLIETLICHCNQIIGFTDIGVV